MMPDGIDDVDELQALYGDSEFEVWECIEKKCLAPYFVKEFMVISRITLDDGEIYPCEVEILPMLEYNRRLRTLVEGHCNGCPGFGELTDSETSLQGHHEEITLDGKCFLRQKMLDYTPDFAEIIDDFVSYFGNLGLEKLIDEGKIDDATMMFEAAFARMVFAPTPAVIITKAADGRYGCYFMGLFDDNDSLIKEYIVDELDNKYGKTWDFQHFLPKGTDTHESVPPKGISFERAEGDRPALEAVIYVGDENPIRAYLYLCEMIGEDRLHTSCVSLSSQSGVADGMQSVSAFADEIDSVLEDYDQKEIMLPPVRAAANFEDGEGEPPSVMINYRSDSLMFGFNLPVRECAPVLDIWNRGDILSMFEFDIARIRFKMPFDPFACDDPEEFECFLDEIDDVCAYLGDSTCAKCFGQEYDDSEYAVDVIVLSLPKLMYKLRYLTPMMTKYDAVLDIYSKNGKNGGSFKIDYSMQMLQSENALWQHVFGEDR